MVARQSLRLLPLAATLLGVGACSTNIFDTDVQLASHSYQADFGNATGTIPTVACGADMTGVCDLRSTAAVVGTPGPTNVSVDIGCDPATKQCFAAATARLTYQLDVLQDGDFVSTVGRHSSWLVKQVQLAYTVPVNTLTFAIPKVDVYVGPVGSTTETDPGVVFVDSSAPLPPGTTVTQPQTLVVADGSPARDLIVSSVEGKQSFVFVVVMTPRIEAGAPIPAGSVELDIQPTLTLGF